MRRMWRYALGALLIAALGCKGHPELSKTNDKNSSEWKRTGSGSLSIFSIASGNRIDTPGGEKIPSIGVMCDSDYHSMEVVFSPGVEPENGAVSVGFDGGLSPKNWNLKSNQIRDRTLYSLRPSDEEQADVFRQIRQANEFQFEFTPKGGKPQRTRFKLLNLNSLVDQDENCKKAAIPSRF